MSETGHSFMWSSITSHVHEVWSELPNLVYDCLLVQLQSRFVDQRSIPAILRSLFKTTYIINLNYHTVLHARCVVRCFVTIFCHPLGHAWSRSLNFYGPVSDWNTAHNKKKHHLLHFFFHRINIIKIKMANRQTRNLLPHFHPKARIQSTHL